MCNQGRVLQILSRSFEERLKLREKAIKNKSVRVGMVVGAEGR